MSNRQFAIGDVTVPAMAIGTMYFGTQVSLATSHACLDAAFDIGARFWDTANNYAFWAGGVGDESESTIGRWLAAHGPTARSQVVIATKIGARPRDIGGDLTDAVGLSATAVRRQVDDSLKRLGTDYVDILYTHIDDPDTPFEETFGALRDLARSGKIREVAASNLTTSRLLEAMAADVGIRYQAVQERFSYLVPSPDADLGPHVMLDDDTAAVCREWGLLQLGYSPLLSGAYTRSDRPFPPGYRPTRAALSALDEVASAHRVDAGQAVLAWMVGRSSPVIPVVGVSAPEQITAAWRAVGTTLSAAQTRRLDEARHV